MGILSRIRAKINILLKKYLPDHIYQVVFVKYVHMINKDKENAYSLPYFHSKKKSNERYCIFRFQRPNFALFAAANKYIFAYEWAVNNGYIPVVDMEYGYYFRNYLLGECNEWEDIFEQPLTVLEVLKKDWVLVKGEGLQHDACLAQTCMDINGIQDDNSIRIVRDNWREYYAKVNNYVSKCWRFKKELLDEFEKEYGEIFRSGNILGVALRENFSVDVTGMLDNNHAVEVYSRHPKTIGVKDIISLVKEYDCIHEYSYIFVSTIYEESLKMFVEIFGDKVKWVKRNRMRLDSFKATTRMWRMNEKEQSYYLKFLQSDEERKEIQTSYVKEILGLSHCNYLVAAPCSGSIAALSLNGGKYKDVYILPDLNESKLYWADFTYHSK